MRKKIGVLQIPPDTLKKIGTNTDLVVGSKYVHKVGVMQIPSGRHARRIGVSYRYRLTSTRTSRVDDADVYLCK